MAVTAGGQPSGDELPDLEDESDGIDRRTLLRRTAVAGATVTVASQTAPRYSPIGRAAAIDWDRARDAAAVAAAGLVAGPLGAGTMAYYLGDEDDYSNYTGEGALRTEIQAGNVRMQSTAEQLLSSLENSVAFAENVFIPKGMAAVADALNDELTEDEAEDEMAEPIDEHTAGIQKDVLQNCEANLDQWAHYATQLEEHAETDGRDVLWTASGTDHFEDGDTPTTSYPDGVGQWHEVEVELADGSTYDMEVPEFDRQMSTTGEIALCPDFVIQNSDISGDFSTGIFGHYEIEDGEKAMDDEDLEEHHVTLDMSRYDALLDELAAKRGDAMGELSAFVSDTYAHYEPGEIDTSDVVDPTTAYLEFSNEVDDEAFAGAMATSMLGVPRTEEPMTIVLEDDDLEVEGSIYSTEAPDGGFDATGSTTYDPAELDYTVMMRYTAVTEDGEADEGRFTEIDQPFTITEATDGDGNAVDDVDTDPSVEWDPAEIESIQDQLDQIQEEQIRLQNEAEEDDDSWLPSLPGLGGGASTLVYLFLGLTGFGLFVIVVLVMIAMVTR